MRRPKLNKLTFWFSDELLVELCTCHDIAPVCDVVVIVHLNRIVAHKDVKTFSV